MLATRVLMSEIDQQCRFALMAYQDGTAALKGSDPERLWYSLHSLLAAAKNITSVVWPRHDEDEAGVRLRTALGIRERSPLIAPDRDLATVVHNWIRSGAPAGFARSNFDSRGVRAADPAQCARVIDPDSSRLVLFGEEFDLPLLVSKIAEIGENAKIQLDRLDSMM